MRNTGNTGNTGNSKQFVIITWLPCAWHIFEQHPHKHNDDLFNFSQFYAILKTVFSVNEFILELSAQKLCL